MPLNLLQLHRYVYPINGLRQSIHADFRNNAYANHHYYDRSKACLDSSSKFKSAFHLLRVHSCYPLEASKYTSVSVGAFT
jgi:hypothetical protein